MTNTSPKNRVPNPARLRVGVVFVGLGILVMVFSKLAPGAKRPPPPEVPRHLLSLRDGRLFLDGSSAPFTGCTLETNATGGLLSRSFVSNGLLEGMSAGYHTNGQMQVLEQFRAGVSDGLRTKWYPNGSKASEAPITQGKIEGIFRRWAEDGSLAEEVPMKSGEPDGLSRSYHPDGSIKVEALMRQGQLVEQHTFSPGERRPPPR